MRFELIFAIRFLRAVRQSRWARFTATTATIGIAAGVAATIFANALANGFRREMQDKILGNTAHITISKADETEIENWQDLSRQVERIENVRSVRAVVYENALLVGKTDSAFAVLKAVQSPEFKVQSLNAGSDDQRMTDDKRRTTDEEQKIRIEIGEKLAQKTGLSVGDAATIVAGGGAAILNGARLNQDFAPTSTVVEVGKVFSTGFYEYDSTWARASLGDAARLIGSSEIAIAALEIETADVFRSDSVARRIETISGADYKVLSWRETNQALFAALGLERRVAILIVSIVVFVAVLNVTTTLGLIVTERRADAAILKTCGAKARNITLIFLLQGAILGAIGAIGGGLLGIVVCAVCNRFELINLPPDVYSVNQIVLQPQLFDVLLTSGAAFLLSLLASAFPAFAAARTKPLENLRQ